MSNGTNNIPADTEIASSSSKDEIIRGLNGDLAREYKAIIQYVVFSSTLKGAEYGEIAQQLKEHASQELEHALEVAKQNRLSRWRPYNERRRGRVFPGFKDNA